MSALVLAFRENVARAPGHPAILGGPDYAALDAASDNFARHLCAAGLRPGQVVALRMARSTRLVIAILGVLKAGGVVFPVGTAQPPARLAMLLEEAGAALVLTDAGLAPLPKGAWLGMEAADFDAPAGDLPLPALTRDPGQAAFLFHSSGTTGRPKVMAIAEPGLLRMARRPEYCEIGPQSRVAHLANPAFDALSFEIWGALLNGATLVPFDAAEVLDLDRFAARLVADGVTTAFLTTSYFNLLASEKPEALLGLRDVLFGGEQANAGLLHRLLVAHPATGCRLTNCYGPTECTTFALWHRIDPALWARADHPATVPVGRPLRETTVAILNDAGAPVPEGDWGEIWLGGSGLSLGYPGRAEETAARFRPGPDGTRLFRTGDQGRVMAGVVECGGRLDDQVKLRGQRIELPEIEAQLLALPGVEQAAVLLEDAQLVAHVAAPGQTAAALRLALAERLPGYMLPARIALHDRLPLTENGKTDRAALRALPLPEGLSFVAQGGDSLSAARLMLRLRAEGRAVDLSDLLSDRPLEAVLAEARPVEAEPLPAPQEDYPAAAEQRRLWLMQQVLPGSTAYSIPLRFDFAGAIDEPAMQAALNALLARHAALRSAFVETGAGLRVHIAPPRAVPLEQVAEAEAFFARPFDLTEGCLLRAGVTGQSLLLCLHHIVVDGAGLNLLLANLAALYRGEEPEAAPGDYSAYPALQAARQASTAYAAMRKARVTDLLAAPEPEADAFYAPEAATGRMLGFDLSPELTHRLKTLAARRGQTLFSLLLAGFALCQWRMGLGRHLSIGLPVGLRPPGFDATVGMFVNTQLCRFRIDPEAATGDWLASVEAEVAAMRAAHDLAYDHVVEDLRAAGQRGGLFDTMFVLENTEYRLPGVQARFRYPEKVVPRFPLTLFVTPEGAGLSCQIEHDLTRFDHDFAQQMAQVYPEVLAALVNLPARLEDLRPAQDLLARIEADRRADPQAIAATHGGERISRAALDLRVQGIAARLQAAGVRPGDLVGVSLRPGIGLVAAVLGILRAGAAYVPLDPDYPADRLAIAIEDTGLAHVITDGAAALPAHVTPHPPEGSGTAPLPAFDPDRIAYVIFTSGSTGRPKGVPIPHRGLGNYLDHVAGAYFGSGPLMAGVVSTSLNFDATVTSLLGPLAAGRRVDVLAGELIPALAAKAFGAAPLLFKVTPAHVAALLAHGQGRRADTPHLFIVGGEQLPAPTVARLLDLLPAARVVNEYGPTETVVGCAVAWAERGSLPEHGGAMVIGRAIRGMRLSVRRADGSPAAWGETGELVIGGIGVAPGYLHRPDLSAERFRPDAAGEISYHTGDRALRLPSGDLVFLGRNDDQIKLKGYRIEPGEIEAAILHRPDVAAAAVVVRGEHLLAYIAPEGVDRAALEAHLAATLPAHMRPARLIACPALPLSPSGKVDRAALPAPEVATPAAKAPVTQTLAHLSQVFAEVLGQEIPPDLHFFDAGAGSLALMRVHGLLRDVAPDLAMVDFFRFPTLADLAAHIDQTAAPVAPAPVPRARAEGRIAIIGMAVGLPGAADLAAFAALIRSGAEAIRVTPSDRPGHVNAVSMLDRPAGFDPGCFGLSPRDALLMDPQQRQLLMGAVQALDHAGIDPALAGPVGLVLSSSESSYYRALLRDTAHGIGDAALAMIHEKDFLATRIAHLLGLHGPALTVQTACSSSLVALHQACGLLRDGEAEVCIAGGVAVDLEAAAGYAWQEGHIHSADGHCAPFSDQAKGTVPASGWGLLVLKPLAAAEAAGDRILGLIEGSAINNDGRRKAGFAAPSVQGQQAVIAAALAAAGAGPSDIGYIEAHGTATALGDPIEVEALAGVFTGQPAGAIGLGSVKSQIGHLGAGAGVAGLIRAVLGRMQGSLPPTHGFTAPHPALDFTRLPFAVARDLRPWPADRPLAGVSSFGIGGTNAHVVLGPAPERRSTVPSPLHLLCLAAHSEPALRTRMMAVADYLAEGGDLAAVAAGLRRGLRDGLPWRAAVVADTADAAVAGLDLAQPRRVTDWSGAVPQTVEALARAWVEGMQTRHLPPAAGIPAWDLPPYAFDLTDYIHPALTGEAMAARLPFDDWFLQPVWRRSAAVPVAAKRPVYRPGTPLPEGSELVLDLRDSPDPASALLALLGAEGRRLRDAGGMLWVLVSGAFGPEGTTDPDRAMVAGLMRAAVAELPGLRLGLVDGAAPDLLPPADPAPFRQIALRGSRVFEAALMPAETPHEADLPPGLYLMTGGNGGMASAMAEALTADPGREVWLLSRRGTGVQGPRIRHIAADVTDDTAMSALAADLAGQGRRLAGVIHAAGLAGGRALPLLQPEAFAATLAPKRDGARAVLLHLAPLTDGFILLCSSLSAQRPAPGQADYAAANAWLDGFADSQPGGAGPKVISVGWPAWQGTGMSARLEGRMADLAGRLEAGAISAGEGMQVLRRAVALGLTHLVVAPLPPDLPMVLDPEPPRAPAAPDLAQIFAGFLGVDSVDPDASFFDLGGDSLLALDLLDAVEQQLGIKPPAALLSGRLSLRDLAAALAPAAEAVKDAPICLRPGAAPPLVLLHPVGGDVASYRALAQAMRGGAAVLALDDPAFHAPDLPEATLREQASALLARLPDGPVWLGGWSYGGVLACEMAAQAPDRVLGLALIDPPSPHQADRPEEGDFLAEITHRRALGLAGGGEPAAQPYLQALSRVWARNVRALASHVPEAPLHCPARLWLAEGQGQIDLRRAAWEALLPGLATTVLPGDHFSVLQGAGAVTLAEGIAQLMTTASRSAAE
ncbi:non-ribosomal peptide synthetase [Gemmobacter nanjingensis]|uniref:Non-ribosomal peptide synthetase n=1 Tax=Gemmobacter nanjingensis TaxID=488454 RepID=A0ABQ3FRB4_9RHOB|nr:non-ribosomal peptide synthetase [Gemmobacter nanjingensis]GHC35473.1 non-ribosomal peptide synthetase [Gemmobacter nanjingensis]